MCACGSHLPSMGRVSRCRNAAYAIFPVVRFSSSRFLPSSSSPRSRVSMLASIADIVSAAASRSIHSTSLSSVIARYNDTGFGSRQTDVVSGPTIGYLDFLFFPGLRLRIEHTPGLRPGAVRARCQPSFTIGPLIIRERYKLLTADLATKPQHLRAFTGPESPLLLAVIIRAAQSSIVIPGCSLG